MYYKFTLRVKEGSVNSPPLSYDPVFSVQEIITNKQTTWFTARNKISIIRP